MKWIFGRTAMWIWATFAVATMAFAAAQDVQLPDGDGKKILQTSCTACHGSAVASSAFSQQVLVASEKHSI